MHFPPGTLAPGERLGSFELFRPDGSRISSHGLIGGKPTLLIMGSVSCPMTAASVPAVKRLHSRFGPGINFVKVNMREAHPGENITQPKQMAEKLQHTRAPQTQLAIPFPLAVVAWTAGLFRPPLPVGRPVAALIGVPLVLIGIALIARSTAS